MEDGSFGHSREIESLAETIATNEKNRDAQIAAMEKRQDQRRDDLLEIIKIMHEGHMESVKALTENVKSLTETVNALGEKVNALGETVNALGEDTKNLRVDMRDMEKRLVAHVETTVDVHRQETKAMEASVRGDVSTLEASVRGDVSTLEASVRGDVSTLETSVRGDVNTLETSLRGELKLMKMSIRMFWIPAVTLLTLVGAVAIRTFGPDILIWLAGTGIAP